ncbi:type IV toxin-antitoxin system AbiEi family antitoxin domain-containing protein [Oceanobacillus locisalsi]|uniref:Type IV toxin-antitoxin system AbiEi family antitoxin domain-containing protein n=1 Tax=Oceanobacillus locisalsi TaxID=546107 RepID=A0ABW3NK11_9BACI
MIQSKLIQLFKDHNGILTTKMANKYGIHDSTFRKAVKREDIQKYCQGVYFLDDSYFDDLYMLQLKYPKGVFSHETAVMLHWLSTQYPFVYHVSFPRGYHLINSNEQNIQPYYISKKEMDSEYIDVVDSWDSNPLRVTNLEKTIIDMLRYKKTTPGIIEEMLDDYLSREDKNLDRLEAYGKQFNMNNLINERILAVSEHIISASEF